MQSHQYAALSAAKPTYFEGRWYASRSEAKWAMVFSLLGLPFYYEPEMVTLPAGDYLPDFYLPTLNSFVEVKPDDIADVRFDQLGLARECRVFLVSSNLPQIPRQWVTVDPILEAMRQTIWLKWPGDSPDYMLAREAQGRINIVPISLSPFCDGADLDILRAYVAASSCKFPTPESE